MIAAPTRRSLLAVIALLALASAGGCASKDDTTAPGAARDDAEPAPAAHAMPAEPPPSSDVAPPAEPAANPAAGAGADAGADAAPTQPSEAATRPAVPPSPGPPQVALARFTTAVENREPVDAVSFLSNDQTRIVFFTDLRNLNGTTVRHRWEFQGEVVAEVPFEVGSDRWRVWSSKALQPEWLGDWRVSVVTEDDVVLATETFTYQMRP